MTEPEDNLEDLELAEAAVHLALLKGKIEPMPADLAKRIEAAKLAEISQPRALPRPSPRIDVMRWAGWLAAAACFGVVVYLWSTRKPQPVADTIPNVVTSASPKFVLPPPKPLAQQREELLVRANTVKIPWSATKDPAASGATGDVVYSVAEQRGFMRFHGLAANTPSKEQYQLWIFDKAQDKRYPIDGGVFDIDTATGDVIVPIEGKLKMTAPTLFAVTVEKPGGVVVSKRERIVLTASPI